MKKKIISIVFILIVAGISVVAYFLLQPCKKHNDRNGDGYCDRCGEHFNIVAVYYHEYGAVGDGVTNDYAAIKKAHEVANEHGVPVYGDFRQTYLIKSTADSSGKCSTIPIKTDVDWKGCKFIIDDTNIGYEPGSNKNYNTNIFTIENDYATKTYYSTSEVVQKLNENSITTETKWLNIDLDYPAMLVLYNSGTTHYIRYGGNSNLGSEQQEVVLVNPDDDSGVNIDSTTPIMFDFDKVTKVVVIRTDVKPITVQNAKIETRASKVNLVDTNYYMNRGIMISRSNVTVKNIEHSVTGEIPKYAVVDGNSNIVSGYTYDEKTRQVIKDSDKSVVSDGSLKPFVGHSSSGFIQTKFCNNLLVEDVTFQGRVKYLEGTYELRPSYSSNITIKGCNQSNFFTEDQSGNRIPNLGHSVWGVSGSNYCKNYTFDNCKLTRFDAHCGVYNAKIINSELAVVEIIGAGELYIENTKFHRDSTSGIIQLRSDYGATFNGKITMKDCEVILYKGVEPAGIIQAPSANHNFGYQTYFPNVEIDNLKFKNHDGSALSFSTINLVMVKKYDSKSYTYRSIDDPKLHVKNGICVDGKTNINVYTPPARIELKNNSGNGYNIALHNVPFFSGTSVIGNIQRI